VALFLGAAVQVTGDAFVEFRGLLKAGGHSTPVLYAYRARPRNCVIITQYGIRVGELGFACDSKSAFQ
jgi:hypothetical protein